MNYLTAVYDTLMGRQSLDVFHTDPPRQPGDLLFVFPVPAGRTRLSTAVGVDSAQRTTSDVILSRSLSTHTEMSGSLCFVWNQTVVNFHFRRRVMDGTTLAFQRLFVCQTLPGRGS